MSKIVSWFKDRKSKVTYYIFVHCGHSLLQIKSENVVQS